MLSQKEEGRLLDYCFKMQDLGHPLTSGQLKLKVAMATQTRETPWSASGVPGKSWLGSFKPRHPNLVSRKSQPLEMSRARGLCPTSATTLYSNLQELYNTHNYPPSNIWNCDESGVQAGRSGGATVLAKLGSKYVHTIEPDQREHLSVLSCINAAGGKIPNFYILKGTYFLQDYIKNCEPNAVMAMHPNAWMTKWLFESWISHFIGVLKETSGIDNTNRHLLVLDGHNSHVTLEVVTVTMNSGLDIISLPSHTSHALQPLDVSCFKPFKNAFRQIRDSWSLLNKGKKVEKTHLCEWTSEALEKSLTAKNIKSGFQKTGIWPLNAQAATASINPSQGFQEGQEGYDIAAAGHSNDSDSSNACEDAYQAECNLRAAETLVLEDEREGNDLQAPCEGINTAAPTRHYCVDVQNGEESDYNLNDQHIRIDPAFRAQIHEGNEQNISNFLSLPEIIPAKKRSGSNLS